MSTIEISNETQVQVPGTGSVDVAGSQGRSYASYASFSPHHWWHWYAA